MTIRIHPEVPFASVPQVTPAQQVMGRHFERCVGRLYLCPFDQDYLEEHSKFCRLECTYRKRGDDQ